MLIPFETRHECFFTRCHFQTEVTKEQKCQRLEFILPILHEKEMRKIKEEEKKSATSQGHHEHELFLINEPGLNIIDFLILKKTPIILKFCTCNYC